MVADMRSDYHIPFKQKLEYQKVRYTFKTLNGIHATSK
jgi:hypothetical protein